MAPYTSHFRDHRRRPPSGNSWNPQALRVATHSRFAGSTSTWGAAAPGGNPLAARGFRKHARGLPPDWPPTHSSRNPQGRLGWMLMTIPMSVPDRHGDRTTIPTRQSVAAQCHRRALRQLLLFAAHERLLLPLHALENPTRLRSHGLYS